MNDLSNRLKFPNKTVGPTRVRYLVVDIDTINAYPRYDILSLMIWAYSRRPDRQANTQYERLCKPTAEPSELRLIII